MVGKKINREKEHLVINANLNYKPIGQQDGYIVLDAELFKFEDFKESTSVLLGLETDFYLDLLTEKNKVEDDDSDIIFCATILDSFDDLKLKTNRDNKAITVNSGVLAKFDEYNNFSTIKEIK